MNNEIKTLRKVFWSCVPCKQVDVIILFGATRHDWSDMIKQIQGIDYKYLLISGKWSSGDVEKNIISQAEFIAQQFLNQNIPMNKILLEKKSTNTLENVIFCFSLLKERNILPESICFISKSHHALRCLLTLKKYFGNIAYSCITYDMERNGITLRKVDWEKDIQAYQIIKKEYNKILTYSARGDIAPLIDLDR